MSGPRPVILIGLSGAGKSTVARHAAALLRCGWCDLDDRIVAAAGMPITRLFAEQGEAHFRALERAAMRAALEELPQVIAAGAGWASQPGELQEIGRRALVVHLAVDPAIAARRLAAATDRPLLAGETSPLVRLREQLTERLRWYQQADLEVAADFGAPDVVAAGVAVAARQYGGWASY